MKYMQQPRIKIIMIALSYVPDTRNNFNCLIIPWWIKLASHVLSVYLIPGKGRWQSGSLDNKKQIVRKNNLMSKNYKP